MTTEIKHYSDLFADELYDLLKLRSEVFVVEQNCVYLDLDGKDKDAYHVLVKNEGQLIGTARILKPNVIYKEFTIGRVVSNMKNRHLKVGHQLMKAALNFIGPLPVRLSAQSHLTKFYEKHHFMQTGKEYLEDGIPHSEMLFTPKNKIT